MLTGTLEVTVLESAAASIHGDVYHDLLVQTDEQRNRNEASRVRVAVHVCTGGPPIAGERVRLVLLMGQVTELARAG
ncbi:MAG: hypothetical protein ACREJO_07780 [Phycisphaerales bacterium]